MSKPMIRKAKSPARTNRGRDTTRDGGRFELIGLLPKARLIFNPFTSAQVIRLEDGFGLYCCDEGYFVVQRNAACGFIPIPLDVEDARRWAAAHNEQDWFDEYDRNLQIILKAHGVSL